MAARSAATTRAATAGTRRNDGARCNGGARRSDDAGRNGGTKRNDGAGRDGDAGRAAARAPSRQGEVKHRAAIHGGFGPDLAAVAVDDALGCGEADAGAGELGLGVQSLEGAE